MRKGTTLTKEMFLNHLYNGRDEPELKIIDVFVCKLRKKLTTATGGDTYIDTVWGRGYVLRDPRSARRRNGRRRPVRRPEVSSRSVTGAPSAPFFLPVTRDRPPW